MAAARSSMIAADKMFSGGASSVTNATSVWMSYPIVVASVPLTIPVLRLDVLSSVHLDHCSRHVSRPTGAEKRHHVRDILRLSQASECGLVLSLRLDLLWQRRDHLRSHHSRCDTVHRDAGVAQFASERLCECH